MINTLCVKIECKFAIVYRQW